jgi:APA family basic amino acid/polyamine antiporter
MFRVKSLDGILATAAKKPLHRSLGVVQLTLLGIGSVIGTGIFVLSAEAAQRAGPAMMLAFVIAAAVCVAAGLCYAELSAMVPVAGSAYTYSYATLGEAVAFTVGWALILENAVAASAVSVGWSGYVVGLLTHLPTPIVILPALANGPLEGGIVNLPAIFIALLITALLVAGTSKSAKVNAVLVIIKLIALGVFVVIAAPVVQSHNYTPFAPMGGSGVVSAAASIFFAYVGFDTVSTASEETRNPQRNVPIALIAGLTTCTLVYVIVAASAIGSYGAQPLFGLHGEVLPPGTSALSTRCAELIGPLPMVCSNEALAHVLRQLHHPMVGNLLGIAAGITLPSVILASMYAQIRVFFAMARDGLLPPGLSAVHPRFHTPHRMTIVTGLFVALAAAFLPVGQLADFCNSGTLYAFVVVAAAVMLLRIRQPERKRPFMTPFLWVTAPIAIAGCFLLFFFLPIQAKLLLPIWTAVGLTFYFLYGYRHSHIALGLPIAEDEHAPD